MVSDAMILERLSSFGRLLEYESLARHTTMRLGGLARWFLFVSDRAMVSELLRWLQAENIPWVVLGGGSNTVASACGWNGVVLVLTFSKIEILSDGTLIADAGAITALFARKATEAGWSGWEWGVGLPGTIGGAIVGNAGCYGGETRDQLESVEIWSATDRMVKMLSADECLFGYRESRFKRERDVIFRGIWKAMPSADQEASLLKMQTILKKRKEEQPLGVSSAGCLFKNVEADEALIQRVEKRYGPIPEGVRALGRVPAGWLVEKAGLKNHGCGGMRVSDRHANFAIQESSATVEDWMKLRDEIQMKVFEETGVKLETEVRVLG